jgi:hypothetical protein
VGFELPQVVDVMAMAFAMVEVAYVGVVAFAMAFFGIDLMPTTSNGTWSIGPHSQVSSHFGNSSLDGLLNLQRVIEGVKTHWIEIFLIPLKISRNIDVKNGLA